MYESEQDQLPSGLTLRRVLRGHQREILRVGQFVERLKETLQLARQWIIGIGRVANKNVEA